MSPAEMLTSRPHDSCTVPIRPDGTAAVNDGLTEPVQEADRVGHQPYAMPSQRQHVHV